MPRVSLFINVRITYFIYTSRFYVISYRLIKITPL